MTLAQPRFLTFTDVLTQPQARVLAAILHMADDAGPITVRSIGEACGLSSSSSVWFILKQLRALDLVTWQRNRAGTIRPLVAVRRIEIGETDG